MNRLVSVCFALMLSTTSFAQEITDGTWYNDEKTSRIKFFKSGGKLYGKIVWLKEPSENGKP